MPPIEDLPALDGAVWFKSTYTNPNNCVEVAFLTDGLVALRDTKFPDKQPFVFFPGEWDAFIRGVKEGQFDRG